MASLYDQYTRQLYMEQVANQRLYENELRALGGLNQGLLGVQQQAAKPAQKDEVSTNPLLLLED